ncbi:MAG: hypothetical protein PHP95_11905 [Desulfuromonadaceae bacterium]|nr:hypothetical protein [Desulfuromonadaceae bacterium]MDD2849150.1 hypothetical protein [Desulfuromonadaceae bacterium]MDD4129518.1 hypothetical protein [Desulfuromonadaceae bacterium]
MKYLLLASLALLFLTGCASNASLVGTGYDTAFVYKPAEPVANGPKLPITVAVLPFKDGTGDFTKLGSIFDPESLTFNLVKSGIDGIINALPPELWAQAFADDLSASGAFRAVRFVSTPADLHDEDFYIKGTVKKAYAAGGWTRPSEYAFGFQLIRRSDNRLVLEKDVAMELMAKKSDFEGCGTNIRCMAERSHAAVNRVMQSLFADARAGIIVSISSPSGGRTGQDAAREGDSLPSDQDSIEQTIDRILQGK